MGNVGRAQSSTIDLTGVATGDGEAKSASHEEEFLRTRSVGLAGTAGRDGAAAAGVAVSTTVLLPLKTVLAVLIDELSCAMLGCLGAS